MTPALNAYLTTEYLYHWICLRCGNVHHSRPGGGGDECVKCGNGCWKTLCANPHQPEPWYVQVLDQECATCRKTLSEVTRLDAQMELFEVSRS